MKGKGPRDERETVINFNEAEPYASIWTASRPLYRKLLKLGWLEGEDSSTVLADDSIPMARGYKLGGTRSNH